jgi:hypothetical protein
MRHSFRTVVKCLLSFGSSPLPVADGDASSLLDCNRYAGRVCVGAGCGMWDVGDDWICIQFLTRIESREALHLAWQVRRKLMQAAKRLCTCRGRLANSRARRPYCQVKIDATDLSSDKQSMGG